MSTETAIADARRDFERTYRMFFGARSQWEDMAKDFQAKQAALEAQGEELNTVGTDVQRLGEQCATLWRAYMQLKEPGYAVKVDTPASILQSVRTELVEVTADDTQSG